jgi:hypothetical protein
MDKLNCSAMTVCACSRTKAVSGACPQHRDNSDGSVQKTIPGEGPWGDVAQLLFAVQPGQKVFLGRDPKYCDIVVSALWMSRRHMAFANVEGRCYVESFALQHMFLDGRELVGRQEMMPNQELVTGDLCFWVVRGDRLIPRVQAPS